MILTATKVTFLLSSLIVCIAASATASEQTNGVPSWAKLVNRIQSVEGVLLNDERHKVTERTKHREVSKAEIPTLQKLFQNNKQWSHNISKCEPQFGGRLIFHVTSSEHAGDNSKTSELKVDVCFSCYDYAVELNGKGNFLE